MSLETIETCLVIHALLAPALTLTIIIRQVHDAWKRSH